MSSSDIAVRVVIPARYGSTRLPGKPLIDLGGEPMIVRVHEAASTALPDADVVVATDDERVESALRDRRIPAVMTDPNWESGTDRVAEVARMHGWADSDVILNLQGDEPLVPAKLLQAFSAFCRSGGEFEMGTVAVPMLFTEEIMDPNVVKVVSRKDGSAIMFSRAPIPFERDRGDSERSLADYRRHLGIYAYRNDVLQRLTAEPVCRLEQLERLEQLRALWLGISISVLDWPESPPGGVDTEQDVDRVREWLGAK